MIKKKLILLNASPVGDHILLLDLAHRFYLSGKIKTIMFIKHNFEFLTELGEGYTKFVDFENFDTWKGKIKFFYMFLHSIFYKNILIYFLPILYKDYLIFTGNLFNKLTKCKVISLKYKGLEKFIPSGIHIDTSIHEGYYYEISNKILKEIGLTEILETPQFQFIENEKIKDKFNIKNKFIVVHPNPSHRDRRLKDEEWRNIFKDINPNLDILFTGSTKDLEYLNYLSKFIKNKNIVHILPNLSGQDTANIFNQAEELFMVHTGPTHLAAALHKKMTVFMHLYYKMFDMSYNENAKVIILSRIKDEIELNKKVLDSLKK